MTTESPVLSAAEAEAASGVATPKQPKQRRAYTRPVPDLAGLSRLHLTNVEVRAMGKWSDSTFRVKMRDEGFPRPFSTSKNGRGGLRWVGAEVDAWFAAKQAQRKATNAREHEIMETARDERKTTKARKQRDAAREARDAAVTA